MGIAQDRQLAATVMKRLGQYELREGVLPAFADMPREPFVDQIVDSLRRNRFFELMLSREQRPRSSDPSEVLAFDPLRGARFLQQAGDLEEAVWLVFLATHFGKNRGAGWEYLRRVYGALGAKYRWTWANVTEAPEEFRDWLDQNSAALRTSPGGFGNHRKFESLGGRSLGGTGAVVVSYIDWSGAPPVQWDRLNEAAAGAGISPADGFDRLYKSLGAVFRFGRLARFDYLNYLRRMEFIDIKPGKVYFQGASGPLSGAALLWGVVDEVPASKGYEARAAVLDQYLNVGFDVIEDALCN